MKRSINNRCWTLPEITKGLVRSNPLKRVELSQIYQWRSRPSNNIRHKLILIHRPWKPREIRGTTLRVWSRVIWTKSTTWPLLHPNPLFQTPTTILLENPIWTLWVKQVRGAKWLKGLLDKRKLRKSLFIEGPRPEVKTPTAKTDCTIALVLASAKRGCRR